MDDYGGPYREVFQQVCDELQAPDPGAAHARRLARKSGELGVAAQQRPDSWEAAVSRAHGDGGTADARSAAEQDARERGNARAPDPCFLPLLLPTPNWTAGECKERYCYTLHPGSSSSIRMELYCFMGKLMGLAIRSRLSMDLNLPSLIWKSLVREPLHEMDLASIDVHAADFVHHLSGILERLRVAKSQGSEGVLANAREEAFSLIQDLNWTCVRSDGKTIELIPGGSSRTVAVDDLQEYLTAYIEARLTESSVSIDAFRNGLLSVVPERALCLMTGDGMSGEAL